MRNTLSQSVASTGPEEETTAEDDHTYLEQWITSTKRLVSVCATRKSLQNKKGQWGHYFFPPPPTMVTTKAIATTEERRIGLGSKPEDNQSSR